MELMGINYLNYASFNRTFYFGVPQGSMFGLILLIQFPLLTSVAEHVIHSSSMQMIQNCTSKPS